MMWKDVPGFEGMYEVSDNGLIRNWTTWHLIKPRKSSDGGLTVTLRVAKDKYKTFRVNRLVALVYIPNPNNHNFVKPKDGNKENNTVENLYWSRTKQDIPLKEVNIGCVYRNKKTGNLYYTIKLVRHTETQEIMVEIGRAHV